MRKSTTAARPIDPTARVRIVRAKVSAASASSVTSFMKIGTNGAASPAAMKTSNKSSGRTNAALYASSSAPAPYVRAKIRSRTNPIA
jgi:hypothetical protein